MQRDTMRREMVQRLQAALGDALISVVLHGPEAHDDSYRDGDTSFLLIVAADLEPTTLLRLSAPVRWWLGRGQPWPRLFAPGQLRDAADVYPIEVLDISRHHRLLHGSDPLAGIEIDPLHLRLQCERELRERLMRLREGFVESDGRAGQLRDLLAVSYPSFAQVFRGCLHLFGIVPPRRDHDVVTALCRRIDLDPAPFDGVARIARAEPDAPEPLAAFDAYYRALRQAEARVDRWIHEGSTP
jgi:hypothetical protein